MNVSLKCFAIYNIFSYNCLYLKEKNYIAQMLSLRHNIYVRVVCDLVFYVPFYIENMNI